MNKIIVTTGIVLGIFFISGCSGTRPASIGVNNGNLASCPDKPNCVSSQSTDDKHFIEPISYTTARDTALKTLKKVLSTQEKMLIVEEADNYLHVEFKSKLFGFVDDVEFYLPENKSLIHIRSASRVGYSDLGVNRKRIERLRALFNTEFENK